MENIGEGGQDEGVKRQSWACIEPTAQEFRAGNAGLKCSSESNRRALTGALVWKLALLGLQRGA